MNKIIKCKKYAFNIYRLYKEVKTCFQEKNCNCFPD